LGSIGQRSRFRCLTRVTDTLPRNDESPVFAGLSCVPLRWS
jgi:hypothetical protein